MKTEMQDTIQHGSGGEFCVRLDVGCKRWEQSDKRVWVVPLVIAVATKWRIWGCQTMAGLHIRWELPEVEFDSGPLLQPNF
jgi:hypothetical protein